MNDFQQLVKDVMERPPLEECSVFAGQQPMVPESALVIGCDWGDGPDVVVYQRYLNYLGEEVSKQFGFPKGMLKITVNDPQRSQPSSTTANVPEGQAGAEQPRDRQPQAARRVSESESMPASLRLRLWLPGYHTPSLNVTKGGHWKQYYGLKQEAAKVLLGVLKETPGIPAKALLVVDGIAQGGQGKSRGGNRALLKAFGGKQATTDRGRVRVGGRGRDGKTVLKYTRVTCQPLDTENLCGSTKALTDCLVKAFPEWLPDDAPEFVEIQHAQVRCGSKCEQGTWVELSCGEVK